MNYEPTVDLFDTLVAQLDLKRFDVIVAVGGGSVLDVAKGLAVIGSFGGHIRDYAGVDKVPGVPSIKVVTVPTTSGTGSEISDGVVLIDEARHTKFLVISQKICPTVALTDPLDDHFDAAARDGPQRHRRPGACHGVLHFQERWAGYGAVLPAGHRAAQPQLSPRPATMARIWACARRCRSAPPWP